MRIASSLMELHAKITHKEKAWGRKYRTLLGAGHKAQYGGAVRQSTPLFPMNGEDSEMLCPYLRNKPVFCGLWHVEGVSDQLPTKPVLQLFAVHHNLYSFEIYKFKQFIRV